MLMDSPDRRKAIERAMLALRTKEFLANGGKIQQVPPGASAAPVSMTHREQGKASWRARSGG